jgi:hypothetical protein
VSLSRKLALVGWALGRTGVEQLSQKYFSALAGCSLHLRLIVSMQCGIGLRDESKLKPTHRTIETHHGWMHIQQDYSVLSPTAARDSPHAPKRRLRWVCTCVRTEGVDQVSIGVAQAA